MEKRITSKLRLRAKWTTAAFAVATVCLVAIVLLAVDHTNGSWRLVWHDEFNGKSGASPTAQKWAYRSGPGYPGELEYYTSWRANSHLDGKGDLVIIARKENYRGARFTSARLTTDQLFTQKYGLIEARIKVAGTPGLWSAFWMLGDDCSTVGWPRCGEIDIMENLGRLPSSVFGTIHGPGFVRPGLGAVANLSTPAANAFHVYSIQWSPTSIKWFVDNKLYGTQTPSATGMSNWVFDHPFYLILDLAVGGPGSWARQPNAHSRFPATMVVDYVRVYAYRHN